MKTTTCFVRTRTLLTDSAVRTWYTGSRVAASPRFAQHKADELGVGCEIALPQPSRLFHESPRPFEPQSLHRLRCPLDKAGQHVEAAADAHDDWHIEAVTVGLAEHFLERARHAHEEHVRRAGADLF